MVYECLNSTLSMKSLSLVRRTLLPADLAFFISGYKFLLIASISSGNCSEIPIRVPFDRYLINYLHSISVSLFVLLLNIFMLTWKLSFFLYGRKIT